MERPTPTRAVAVILAPSATMDIAIPSEQISFQAGTLWTWLFDAARAVAKALRIPRELTAAERMIVEVAVEMGGPVLDAESVAELRSRLYRIAVSERLMKWETAFLKEFDVSSWPTAEQVEASMTASLGDSHLVHECSRLMAIRVALVRQIVANLDIADIPDDMHASMLNGLSDFRTPAVVRSLFEETMAGEAALLVLMAPLVDPVRWQCAPWMRLALLEQVRLASVSHLRLLSVVPGLTIPEDVLPVDERLDCTALDQESRVLSRFLLPAELPVGRKYVNRLREAVEGRMPAPAGVRALFAD